ncbi:MAG: E3 binding domain-containing protein, partial [Chloroflexi bacterium]|nr:E3 binding domain-containing protein [Chloroflexota bacterium]
MSVTKVILPKLGLTMDEGKIVAWRKREGDAVAAGEILFEVETDKATMEVEAPAAGVVRKIFLTEGATAPVTTLIAVIADSATEPLGDVASEPVAPGANASSLTRAPSAPSSAPSPAPADGERVRSSPAARKRAQELGVDIEKVKGTGPGGRVTLEDVDAAAARPPAAAPVAAPST